MKTKFLRALICCIVVLVLLFGALPVSSQKSSQAVGEAQGFIDGIVAYKLKKSGALSVQQWIDGSITKNAGTSSEWYAIALSQYGSYDFSAYENALLKYLSANQVSSASSRQKYALALIACGSTDSYIYSTLSDCIGRQGVMSWIFGLHLLNNGYTVNEYSLSDVKQKLLSLQLSDGGWSVMGSYSDIDVTAMALQALACYYENDYSVKTAVDKALIFLSNRQLTTGDYASYGVNNPESTAQVLVALSSLGIDCKTDSRFIKNGKTLFDGIRLYQLSDGSFCHKQGGGFSATATVQVFCSMVSYLRMGNGRSGLYVLDARNPSDLKIPDNTTSSKPTETAPSASQPASGVTSTAKPSTTPSSSSTGPTETSTPTQSNNSSEIIINSQTQSEVTSATIEQNDETTVKEGYKNSNYKLWVSVIIIIVAGGVCILLYLSKKRNINNLIIVVSAAIVAIIIVLLTDFQTTDEYYNNVGADKNNVVGTVTLTIRCDSISDKSAEHIPDDGVILDVTEFEIQDGDTVYDILLEATGTKKIHLETSGSADSVYVEGINNIYEFDFGDLSGWGYYVNGNAPSVSCGEYKLSADDKIQWLYTCDLGKDLK